MKFLVEFAVPLYSGNEARNCPEIFADASGRSTGKKPVLAIIFLENAREFLESITNTGAIFC